MADETDKKPIDAEANGSAAAPAAAESEPVPQAANDQAANDQAANDQAANDQAVNDGVDAGAEGDDRPIRPTPITAEQQLIQELEAERDKLKDQLLRTMAEMENVRKRADRDKGDARKFAVAGFARDLLTVADNLQRALDSAPDVTEDDPLSGFLDGVAMTERELLAVFQRNDIVRVDALGERFDHNLHQAMFEVPDSGQPAGTVVQELQPGYTLHERLLRPAMVGVAKGGGDDVPNDVDEIA